MVNETLSGTAPTCATCTKCPAGQYGICNATASVCLACPLGQYTTAAGGTVCVACPAGMSGAASGLCNQCASGAYSTGGGAACVNCSAGAYLAANAACVNCTGGTYSLSGATGCLQCANLTVGNATYAGAIPGAVNATSCPFVCRAGFTYAPASNTCSQCGIGQWSTGGSTLCGACSYLPSNATYSGVGASAIACPFTCNVGFYPGAGICLPCSAGTRLVGASCVPCLPGSYSDMGAVVCGACSSGRYATGGASACSACANQVRAV